MMNLLTVEQVAERLNVSRGCVYSLIQSGKLSCVRIGVGRGVIRVDADDLMAFVDQCRPSIPRKAPRRTGRSEFTHLDTKRLSEAWRPHATGDE